MKILYPQVGYNIHAIDDKTSSLVSLTLKLLKMELGSQ